MESIRILVVEDDPIIAADLQDRLTESGYTVLGPVAAGEDALSFVEQDNLPDLVLMDIQLEGEWDGIETTRRIRLKHDMPIIFTTPRMTWPKSRCTRSPTNVINTTST